MQVTQAVELNAPTGITLGGSNKVVVWVKQRGVGRSHTGLTQTRQPLLMPSLPQVAELATINAVGRGLHPCHQLSRRDAPERTHQQVQPDAFVLESEQGVLQQGGLWRQLMRHQHGAIVQALDAIDVRQSSARLAQEVRGLHCVLYPGVANVAHVSSSLSGRKIFRFKELSSEAVLPTTFSSKKGAHSMPDAPQAPCVRRKIFSGTTFSSETTPEPIAISDWLVLYPVPFKSTSLPNKILFLIESLNRIES